MAESARTILLTGANGFVGRHVTRALQGHATIHTGNANAETAERVDLLDRSARRALLEEARPDTLIHLAWYTAHGKFWHASENADWQRASVELFRDFYARGGERIVGVGTCAEYDWTIPHEYVAESAPLAPHTAYGEAKLRTAEALATLAEKAGGSWAWARIFLCFGPNEAPERLLPAMRTAIRSGQPLEIGPGGTTRDFWPVEILGEAIARVALGTVSGPVNAASGLATRFDEVAALFEELGETRGLIQSDRRPLGSGEPERLVADTNRLENEVGFTSKLDLRSDITRYLALDA